VKTVLKGWLIGALSAGGLGQGSGEGGVAIVATSGAKRVEPGCIDRKNCVKVAGLAGDAQRGLTRSAVMAKFGAVR
jgi:hypothetical protein